MIDFINTLAITDSNVFIWLVYSITTILIMSVIFVPHRLRHIIIGGLVVCSVALGMSATYIFGNPVAGDLLTNRDYIYRHHLVKDDDVYVWVFIEDNERLYKIPFDEKLKEALQSAKNRQASTGQHQILKKVVAGKHKIVIYTSESQKIITDKEQK